MAGEPGPTPGTKITKDLSSGTAPVPPSRRMTKILHATLPFMATPVPRLPVGTPGTGRGRSQTSSPQTPSSPPITPSDSEFQADKQAGSVPPDVPSCFPGTGQVWLFQGKPFPPTPTLSTHCPALLPSLDTENTGEFGRRKPVAEAPGRKFRQEALDIQALEKEDETASVNTVALTL